jgi:hypothetical protein
MEANFRILAFFAQLAGSEQDVPVYSKDLRLLKILKP